MNIKKSKLTNLLKGSWFVTVFATTLGVLLALYLNNLNARSKIENRKQISIENLDNELSNNKSTLLKSNENDRLIDFLTKVRKIDKNITTELTASAKSMSELKKNYSDFIAIIDSTVVDLNLYEYDIEYTFELSLDDLPNIAWETSKMSNVLSELDYSCLQVLVKIYSLQEIYVKEQQKILNHFVNADHNKLLSAMLIVQQLKSQLWNVMIEGQSEMKNCG